MQPVRTWSYRLYKISMPSALVIATPLLLLLAWYAGSAYADFDRYRRETGAAVELDVELFQLFLHDQLTRDLRRLALGERPAGDTLPTFELHVARAALDALARDEVREGKGSYVDAWLRRDGRMQEVKIRYRGRRHWHRLGAQKSMKVRAKKGGLVDGVRVFNLINDVTPFGLEEQVILELAREHGLLAPEYHPAWVRLNNVDMGVYRFATQPSEGLLRRAGRLPGSIYSGNSDAQTSGDGFGPLFGGLEGWQKAASRVSEEKDRLDELERLLRAVRQTDHATFRDFARQHLDLERFATFDALDVVFGSDQHDFVSNHKLAYDAYRDRWEPIAWNMRGFTHDPRFNRVENPILLRLKSLPTYRALRDRKVHELLVGDASVPMIRARVDALFGTLRPALAADPYWDAYKLLPRASRFHRFMLRPMNEARWLLASQLELRTFARRSRFLLDALERSNLAATWWKGAEIGTLDLAVDGHGAYRIDQVTFLGDCAASLMLAADRNLSGTYEPGIDPVIAEGPVGEPLQPHGSTRLSSGLRLIAREDASVKHGAVVSQRVAQTYRFFVTSRDCAADGLELEVSDRVTGSSRRIVPLPSSTAPGAPSHPASTSVSTRPLLVAGESMPHPWSYAPAAAAEVVRLGPGTVDIDTTRRFASHQTVEIAAGSRLRLGPGVSLLFAGRVEARGTRARPIVIEAIDAAKPFGGIALLGPGTAGSHLRHLRVEGGRHPVESEPYLPSLLSVYDSSAIRFEQLTLVANAETEDVVHATYVDGLRLHEVTIRNAPTDAIDIEMSTATVRGAHIVGAGDECLDLMGSEVHLTDSLLLGCRNNAISAGEETHLNARGVAIAAADVGILAKNASSVRLERSIIVGADRALRTRGPDLYYADSSLISAQDWYAIDCEQPADAARGTRLDLGNMRAALPSAGVLDHLRRQVLELDAWEALDDRLRQLQGEPAP